MNKKEPTKICVIGAGGIGRLHLEAFAELKLALAAVADPSPQAGETIQRLAPEAVVFADWKEALASEAVGSVVIALPTFMHLEVIEAAVAAGKHVFCEKTLTSNRKEALRAGALALRPGQVFQVGFMKRFFPATQQALAWLPEIGTPVSARVRSFQGSKRSADIYDLPSWKPGPEGVSKTRHYACGGILNMAGSHMLDLTHLLLGKPAEVNGRTWAPPDYDAEVHAHGLFAMEGGMLVHFEAAVSNFSRTGAYGNGWDEAIEITGTKGRIEVVYPVWDHPKDHPARARLYLEAEERWQEPEFPVVNPFALQLDAFQKAVAGASNPAAALQDGVLVDLWIDAFYRSARSGRPETVE